MSFEFNLNKGKNENKNAILNLNNIKAIIFDFDDTLYSGGDWSKYIDTCLDFLVEGGYAKDKQEFYDMLKKNYPDYPNLGYRVCHYMKDNGGDINFVYNKFNEKIFDISSENLKFMDYSLLDKLSKKYPIYLISNSPENYIKHYAKLFGIDLAAFKKVFYNLHEGEDFTKAFYMEKCMQDAGSTRDTTLMVGDDFFTDIMPANELGINTYLVDDVTDTENLIKNLLKIKNN